MATGTTKPIESIDDMAVALGKMVFKEVERLDTISTAIAGIEDDIILEVDGNPEIPVTTRISIYRTLSERRSSGQAFILKFVQMLDQRGAFTPPEQLEDKMKDANMVGDLALSDDEKHDLADILRELAQTRVIDAHLGDENYEAPVIPRSEEDWVITDLIAEFSEHDKGKH